MPATRAPRSLEAPRAACYDCRAMKGESALLVAIIAPGSVEARVGKVQQAIFAEHGLTSAVALPPLIPVAFLADAVPGLLATIERAARAPWRIQTAGIAWEGGSLFLAVSSRGLWGSLRDGARSLGPFRDADLFPAFEGFFAGCGDAEPGMRPLIRPNVPDLSFTSGFLATLAIRSPRGRDGWWREVSWEIMEQRPLRGRREE